MVTSLSNENSTIAFAPSALLVTQPTNAAAYRKLTVQGNYTGSNGVVELNTYLNSGGGLQNQFTDRLLVNGNASGATLIDVKARTRKYRRSDDGGRLSGPQ